MREILLEVDSYKQRQRTRMQAYIAVPSMTDPHNTDCAAMIEASSSADPASAVQTRGGIIAVDRFRVVRRPTPENINVTRVYRSYPPTHALSSNISERSCDTFIVVLHQEICHV